MKRLATTLVLIASVAFCMACSSDDSPVYEFPDDSGIVTPKPEPEPEPDPEPVLNYPKGMTVEEVKVEHKGGKSTIAYLTILDFNANPKLKFNPTHIKPSKVPTSVFSSFGNLGRGRAYVATNGGYFYNGESLSLCVTDGEVKSIAAEMAYPKNAEGKQVVAYPVRAALGQMADGSFEATWVYCVADDGKKPYSFPSPLDNDEEHFQYMPNAPTSKTKGAELWEPRQAIGGGPMLVYEGKNVAMENYYKEVLHGGGTQGALRVPRTAVGAKKDGSKMIVLVCDGRGAGGSAGLTISEVADLMIERGMDVAVNLDGGGSSVIVGYDGKVMNHPSDGKQRSVPTAVVISCEE